MKSIAILSLILVLVLSINTINAQTGCENDIIPPEIMSIIGPQSPVELGSNVSVLASFMDECGNPHSGLFDWKENNYPAPITVVEPETGQPGSILGSHRYSFTGVYEVALQIQDSYGNVKDSTFKYIVVYDASAGFVTGGGWIDSPEGAYAPDPTLSGKANFGFVAKYKKGQSTPDGSTQFSFKVANLKFKSTYYDWLVIAGPQAKFKGSGTINGSGDYGFMLTARDGQINGGGGVDRFRIKIWQKDANETIIYDNQMGDGDDGDATDAIEGGSIVIHETNTDLTPPVVIITTPFDGSTTNQNPVPVTWTADGVEQTTELTENLVEGTNQIIRSATDEAGNIGADTITVIYSSADGPVVLITSPTDGYITNEAPITISWTVDGVEQTTDLTADLTEGENQIIRSAIDEAGNVGADTINVTLDTVSPEVAITSPADGFITNETSITITWTVDGVEQTTELTADLTEGSNQIIRSATDEAGNLGADTITVTLDSAAPVVLITSP
ncbi:MAG: hypothetical protein JW956_04140, partial [Calditrichaceae bacterium]|nr:hypothetical protein [Calditrichaceae bacterium]